MGETGAVMQFVEAMLARPPVRALLILLGAVIVAKVVDLLLCRALKRLTQRTATDLDERLIDRLHRPIFVTVMLLGVLAASQVLALPAVANLWIHRGVKTVIIVVWMMAGLAICSEVLTGLSRLSERVTWLEARTLPLFDNLGRLLIVGLAFYAMLLAWNLNIGAWLASAGIAGLAIGFAAKDTLANLFGGLFVIIDAPYKIGDFINLDTGERGRVSKIGLRSTRLLTRDDVEITVPNAAIAAAKIVNESGGPLEHTRVATTVGVAYGSDVDQVREVLKEAACSVEFVRDDPEPRIRFTEMGDSALIFRVLCWIDEPVYRGRCLDGLNTAIYKALNREKIAIPFPQRDVHVYRADALD
jgi:small-conductance mechanosensitive channel